MPETVSETASPNPPSESSDSTAPATEAPAAGSPEPSAIKPSAAAAKQAPAAAKPPAPEDRPFMEFVTELFLPALVKEIVAYGGPTTELKVVEGPMPVIGAPCWMVQGTLPGERRFWLCFTEASIQSPKTVVVAERGSEPSLLESFLIDEKRTTLALLVSRLVQRLNGQKWLGPN
jgi:hypothetical protein